MCVVSSDFAHWGLRFGYTFYMPNPSSSSPDSSHGIFLNKRLKKQPTNPKICESIGRVDKMCMDTVEGGDAEEWWAVLRRTGNTVCGRHPIGVVMCALDILEQQRGEEEDGMKKGRFKFVRYERSSEVKYVGNSSVSYASAFAVL